VDGAHTRLSLLLKTYAPEPGHDMVGQVNLKQI
jgi:hypothetical protein